METVILAGVIPRNVQMLRLFKAVSTAAQFWGKKMPKTNKLNRH